jgi:hypothetical protein
LKRSRDKDSFTPCHADVDTVLIDVNGAPRRVTQVNIDRSPSAILRADESEEKGPP